jgi:hypothetical protein
MFQITTGGTHKLAQSKTLQAIDNAMDKLVPVFRAGKSPLFFIHVRQSADSFGPNRLNHTYSADREEGRGKAYTGKLPPCLHRIQQYAISFENN